MAKESISTTRRMLLGSGCALPFAAFASDTEAKTGVPAKWDREYDVIVVGSGVTGTVAGICAAEKGAQTVVIEKLGRLGGTSRFSGLNFACVGSPAQKAAGVTDTPKALADDMARVSGGLGDYALALKMAENTARATASNGMAVCLSSAATAPSAVWWPRVTVRAFSARSGNQQKSSPICAFIPV